MVIIYFSNIFVENYRDFCIYRIYISTTIVILFVHINLPKWRKAGKLSHKYITLHCFDVAFTSHDVSIWPITNYHAYKVINNICSMYININMCVCVGGYKRLWMHFTWNVVIYPNSTWQPLLVLIKCWNRGQRSLIIRG